MKASQPRKDTDEILASENVETEAGKELRDKKNTDKFGALNMIPRSCHAL